MKISGLIIVLSGFLLNSSLGIAQSIPRSVLSNQGGSFKNAQMQVDYSVGETVISDANAGNTLLSQGFHQSPSGSISIEEDAIFGAVRIYPNPASSWVNVELPAPNQSQTQLILLDGSGRALPIKQLKDNQRIQLDLSTLSEGIYLLVLQNEKITIKRKLIKHM